MALTETQKIKCHQIMGIGYSTGSYFSNYLVNLSETQETMIDEIITQWDVIVFDTKKINTEGVNIDSTRTKAELAKQLNLLLNYLGNSNFNVNIGRG